ncbi:hypothetical protein B566_EDAN004371 [Ephemera danica]|nr:hypothetical protein B566_EDAN004371 [Ephemera danica]
MIDNSAWCRTLTTLEKFAANMVFACMALESVYLHRVLARSFKGQPNMVPYYLSSTVTCLLFVLVWAIVMATTENDVFCWTVDWNELGTHWINDSLRIALLLINLVLLLDIIRVLLTRLRGVKSAHSTRIRRTAKATLWLTPVFGVQFLVTAVQPTTTDCASEQAYYITTYLIESIQGPLVALLYCYTNKEVRMLLRYSWESQCGRVTGLRKPRVSLITDVTELPASPVLPTAPVTIPESNET